MSRGLVGSEMCIRDRVKYFYSSHTCCEIGKCETFSYRIYFSTALKNDPVKWSKSWVWLAFYLNDKY